MTAITQTRMNIVLALVIPAAGLVYLTSGAPVAASRPAAGAVVALGALWLTAIIALNTIRRPEGDLLGRVPESALIPGRRQPVPHVLDVSRPITPWRWTSVLLAPVELLALAWGVPVVILLIMAPVGLALAAALRVGRFILGI